MESETVPILYNVSQTDLTADMFDNSCTELKICEHIGYYVERVAYLENLVKQYKFDMLTGLMMKRDFQDTFNRLFEEHQFASSEFNMCLLDINGLHNVNRTKGYGVGDQLIKSVSDQLKDVFVIHQIYRISGDEFAVLVRNSAMSAKVFKDKMKTINNIEYVINSCDGYTSPKHMFKTLDKKLSVIKAKKSVERV